MTCDEGFNIRTAIKTNISKCPIIGNKLKYCLLKGVCK